MDDKDVISEGNEKRCLIKCQAVTEMLTEGIPLAFVHSLMLLPGDQYLLYICPG